MLEPRLSFHTSTPRTKLLSPLLITSVPPASQEVLSAVAVVQSSEAVAVAVRLARRVVVVERNNRPEDGVVMVPVEVVGVVTKVASMPGEVVGAEGGDLAGRITTSRSVIVMLRSISSQIGRCLRKSISTVWLS